MRYLFVLSMELPEMALAELLTITDGELIERIDNIAVIDCEKRNWKRLALTREVHERLFSCKEADVIAEINRYDWQKKYEKSFKVDFRNTRRKPAELANLIVKKIKDAVVDVNKPETEFHFFFHDKIHATRLTCNIEEDYSKRRPDKLPAMHPSMMRPKMARAVINLTGVPDGKVIVDPFCGAGGFLIEAAKMGLRVEGSDIDEEMLERCKKNLKFAGIKATVKRQDVTKIMKKLDYVVADLPYARNTKKQDLGKLYLSFLRMLEKNLMKRAVVIFPDFVNWKNIVEKTGLRIENSFKQYVHNTLSRQIVVLNGLGNNNSQILHEH